MPYQALFWLYIANSVFLLNHEIDSGYWKEWNIISLPIGIKGFLCIHFPMIFLVLYELILVPEQTHAGLYFSIVTSLVGIFAFSIHTYFIRKGRKEFTNWMSSLILYGMLVISAVQLLVSLSILLTT